MIASNGRMLIGSSSFALANQEPLPVVGFERLEGAVHRIDEPQVGNSFARIDRAFAMQVEAARRGGENLAHLVRCKRDVGRLGILRHSFPAPAREVRDHDVLAEVQLRLVPAR